MNVDAFNTLLKDFYNQNRRKLVWREEIIPFHVVVTELMLQQTQVPRVQTKFPEFIAAFPTFESLANATMIELFSVWQGMGYNRRAKYLKEISTIVVQKYNGIVPQDPELLDNMPGIGPATARSIVTYIYNKPELFIETNVRRVFIHHFFEDSEQISDQEILPILKKALDRSNPREWYYAIMDYGTWLGKNTINANRKSKHYTKQSKFEGSNRQVRGGILKELIKGKVSGEELITALGFDTNKIYTVLRELEKEGFIAEQKGIYTIK